MESNSLSTKSDNSNSNHTSPDQISQTDQASQALSSLPLSGQINFAQGSEGIDNNEGGEISEAAYLQHMQDTLNAFWSHQGQIMEIISSGKNTHTTIPSITNAVLLSLCIFFLEADFKNMNDLPLARIKRIMKSDEDVRMISAEAPVLFAKACELFILELTLRSWCYSEKSKRRTLQKDDIQTAIKYTDIFDFLIGLH